MMMTIARTSILKSGSRLHTGFCGSFPKRDGRSMRRSPSCWHASEAAGERESQLAWVHSVMNPAAFAREYLGFVPDEVQRKILEAAPDFKRIALNCNRQWGKSTIIAILAVHRMLMQPGALVLVVAPAERQSGEFVRKVAGYLDVLGIRARGDGVNDVSKVLPNGSRIVGLPAKDATSRGFTSVSMLIVDEASRLPDVIYNAVRPSVGVSGGDIVLLSTPNGKRGFFYRTMTGTEATMGGEKWLLHTGPVTECPRVPAAFLAEERALGEAYFRQEYMVEYVETGKDLFDEELVNSMVKAGLEGWILR